MGIPGHFPALVIDDAGTSVGDVARATLQVEVFDVFDRVAEFRNANPFTNDFLEIYKLLCPQQVVHLGLSGIHSLYRSGSSMIVQTVATAA